MMYGLLLVSIHFTDTDCGRIGQTGSLMSGHDAAGGNSVKSAKVGHNGAKEAVILLV